MAQGDRMVLGEGTLARQLLRPSRLLLMLAALVIAVVPSVRHEFVWNMRVLAAALLKWPHSDYGRHLVGRGPAPRVTSQVAQDLLTRRPQDVELRVAIARGPLDGQWNSPPDLAVQVALQQALDLAPRNPAVHAVPALGQLCDETLVFHREEEYGRRSDRLKKLRRGWQRRYLTDGQIASPLLTLDFWAIMEPDNAAPDVLAAYLLLGARRDKEALLRVEAASRKQVFTFHDLDFSGALVHTLRICSVNEPDAELAGFLLSSDVCAVSRIRRFARTMAGVGWDRFDAGDTETAFRYWFATGRVGRLLRMHDREPLLTRLAGTAVEAIGYGPVFRAVRASGGDQQGRRLRIQAGEACQAFVDARGEAAANGIRREVSSLISSTEKYKASEDALDALMQLARDHSIARRSTMLALPAALLVAAMWILAFLCARQPTAVLSRAWLAVILAVAIWTTMGLIRSSADWAVYTSADRPPPGSGWHIAMPDQPWLPLGLAFGGPVLLVLLLALGSIWPWRKHKLPYALVLGRGLRQALPGMLAALGVLYVLWASQTVYDGAAVARYLRRGREVGELRMLGEFADDQRMRLSHY